MKKQFEHERKDKEKKTLYFVCGGIRNRVSYW